MQARGPEDLILDGILAKVVAWRNAQVIESASANFVVVRDKSSPWQALAVPLVSLELTDDTRDEKSGKVDQRYNCKGRASCWVPSCNEDAAGKARLYYLKEQVRAALLGLSDFDFGQAVGTLSNFHLDQWSPIDIEDKDSERAIFAGSWEFSFSYGWEPASAAALALSDINATVGRWAALYHFT